MQHSGVGGLVDDIRRSRKCKICPSPNFSKHEASSLICGVCCHHSPASRRGCDVASTAVMGSPTEGEPSRPRQRGGRCKIPKNREKAASAVPAICVSSRFGRSACNRQAVVKVVF